MNIVCSSTSVINIRWRATARSSSCLWLLHRAPAGSLLPSMDLKHDRTKALSLPMELNFSRVWREVACEHWKLRVYIMWSSFVLLWCGGAGSIGNQHTSCWILQELSQCWQGVSLGRVFFTEMIITWGRNSHLYFVSSTEQSLGAFVTVKVPLCFQRCLFCLDERWGTFLNCEYFHTGQKKHFLASLKFTPWLEANSKIL